MSSEERVRTEVHLMANHIQVDTDRQLAALLAQRSQRRGWAPVAAAASVVLVVAAGITLSNVLPNDAAEVDKAVPVVVAGTPDGTVPSVFGHTRESATDLLESEGLRVAYGEQDTCQPEGRPVATEPETGARVEPGDTVTVLLSFQGPLTDCAADLTEPWAFVDFATGRGPAPQFAAEVALFVDGQPTGTLSRADAERGDWGQVSSLTVLADASAQVLRSGDTYRTPYLQVLPGTPPDSWCGVTRPAAVRDREALTLTIDFDQVVPGPRCPARVALYETGGAIDSVVAWSETANGDARQPVPDVVGLALAEARDRVTAAGYAARVEPLEICNPREGIVVEQAPTPQDIEDDRADEPEYTGPVTLVVEVPHPSRDCGALDGAAADFMAFARGGPPPSWASEVRQLLGYTEWDTVTADRADDPAAWSFCSGVAPDECEVSPLVVAGRDVEVATGEYSDSSRYPGDEVCESIDRGGLPDDLYEGQIVLYPAELDSCDGDWSVWLWVDDAGRIEAVNLLVPR